MIDYFTQQQTEKCSETQELTQEKQGENLLAHFAHIGEMQDDSQDHQMSCNCCNKNR